LFAMINSPCVAIDYMKCVTGFCRFCCHDRVSLRVCVCVCICNCPNSTKNIIIIKYFNLYIFNEDNYKIYLIIFYFPPISRCKKNYFQGKFFNKFKTRLSFSI
jgi:hypothetical protein